MTMLNQDYMHRHPEIPAGWYMLAPSRVLKAGSVKEVHVAGRDLVVFRTELGMPRAAWNICPHLGGRLGSGGRVVGELFECPIHHRRFESTEISQGCRLSHDALATIPVCERNGMVFGWYHPEGATPSWELPEADTAGWTPTTFRTFEFATNAEVVMQDLADVEHFTTIHKYEKLHKVDPMHARGAELHVAYQMVRRMAGVPILTDFRSVVAGLGYQRTDVWTFGHQLQTRHYVLPVPISPERIRLHLGLSIRIGDQPSRFMPAGISPLAWAMVPVILNAFVKDVHMDAWAWVRRYHVADLVEHSEPEMALYHGWLRQFYHRSSAPVEAVA